MGVLRGEAWVCRERRGVCDERGWVGVMRGDGWR